ncbi:MAG: hypothetical protein DLM57_06175 [Pseudonocardiales bacterium]|nr:MAG: hypothetical protein DLM57_06175 [Pseudonocardiales bacterium]
MTAQDLDDRLRSCGDAWREQDFLVPPLATMLDRATRRRGHGRRWLAVAATVLVVAAVATIPIVRHAHHGSTPPAVSTPTPLPSTIELNGKTLTRLGTEAWTLPVLDEHDPSVVWIDAEIQGGPSCTLEPVARVESETADAVTVLVATYAGGPLPSDVACIDIKMPPKRLKVTLQEPLGSRQLIDATTGTPQGVLDPATFPAPQFVPAGYEAQPVGWDPKFAGVAIRAYRSGPDTSLNIRMGPPSVLGNVGAVVLDRPVVRGHPATVWQDTNFDDLTCLTWSESATRTFQVCSSGSPAPLDAAALVRVADSLH